MLLKHAMLHPIASPSFIGDLRVKDGIITEIGRELQEEAGELTYDCTGKHITPGLIDSHTHLGLYDEGTGWAGNDANETIDVITPHIRALDGCYPLDSAFKDARKWGITTVNIMPGSANVIGGLASVIKTAGKRVDDMILLRCSGLKMALGENPKKRHSAGNQDLTRMGIMGMLRKVFTETARMMESGKEIPFELEPVSWALKGEIPVRIHAHRADDILSALRFASEFSLDLRIEHCTEGHLIADELALSPVPVTIGPTLTRRSKVELKNKSWEVYAALAKRNIPFSITTDHPYVPIQYLRFTASMAVQEGLSEELALRGITLSPAENLGVAHRVGSLETGKDADFVVWTHHPFDYRSRATYTFINGKVVHTATSV